LTDKTRRGVLAALKFPDFARFVAARFLATIAWQMVGVAVGWQVYALTHNPLALGLVGLSQFLPFVVLVLPAGHVADRADRRLVMLGAYAVEAVCVALLMGFTLAHSRNVAIVFAATALFGAGRAFWMPTGQAMVPNLVPAHAYTNAIAVHATLFQIAVVAGPALGGLLYLWSPMLVYAVALTILVIGMALMAAVSPVRTVQQGDAFSLREVLGGLHFVLQRRAVLGAISLDLFAVLFGGATALLPIYASDVLHVGPAGLGLLRTAPGAGAALTSALLASYPIRHYPGRWMFSAVALYGAATIVFGLSTRFALSLIALGTLGAADMVSVFVRHVLVQLETPDAIRGRVSAVSSLFIGASNELGEFESGVTAKWLGAVTAVVVGGCATLGVIGAYLRLFPQLRRMRQFPEASRGR
jgi:MFS family permease